MKLEETGYRQKFLTVEGQEQSCMEETGSTKMKQSLSLMTDYYKKIIIISIIITIIITKIIFYILLYFRSYYHYYYYYYY